MAWRILVAVRRRVSMPRYSVSVNEQARVVDSPDPDQPLLYVLRNALGLHAAKFGCGLGQCGACTVLLDGRAVRSCQVPIGDIEGRAITTLEGLGTPEAPHPLQAAFIAEQVPQCGYCTSGIIMTAAALLSEVARPTEAEVRTALDANLCRCGSHVRVVRAVLRAAETGAH
jgi:nicotinate dehydrogenase subunit A